MPQHQQCSSSCRCKETFTRNLSFEAVESSISKNRKAEAFYLQYDCGEFDLKLFKKERNKKSLEHIESKISQF